MSASGFLFAPASTDTVALTDNTGETPDNTIALVDTTVGTVTSAGAGASTLSTTAVATTASVNTALGAVDTRLDLVNKNFSDLAAKVNAIRTNLRAVGLMK